MDDKKKKYIIIGAVVLVVLYFVMKNSGEESSESSSLRKAAESLNSGLATVGTAVGVQKTAEDEEYQNLLQELKTLNGGVLPSGATTLTSAQLRTQIKNVKALEEAYLKYADEETDESKQLTMEQLIEQGKGTLAAIQQLTREVEQRKQDEWLTGICNRFIASAKNNGDGGSCWKKAQAWDENVLNEMLALTTAEKKRLNTLYYQITGGGLTLYGKDCGLGGKHLCASIYAVCNLPMNCAEGTTRGLSRYGWQTCKKVRDAFKNIS